MGKYEYIYDYLDWYLQIQIQILLHTTFQKINMFIDIKAIQVSTYVPSYTTYGIWFIIVEKIQHFKFVFNIFWKIQILIYLGWQKGQIRRQIYTVRIQGKY